MKPDYESVGGPRWMRWTEGVGHSARPYSNTWKPYSQSLDTLGGKKKLKKLENFTKFLFQNKNRKS